MWAPWNTNVISALLLTFFLSWLIHMVRDSFLQIPGPAKQLVKLTSCCFRKPELIYFQVLTKHNNFNVGWLKTFSFTRWEGFMSPKIIVSYGKIHPKSVGTFEKRPQISTQLFRLIYVTFDCCLALERMPYIYLPIVWLIDWLLSVWNNLKWFSAMYT